MRTIWKFPCPLSINGGFTIVMPERAQVLTVQCQQNQHGAEVPCLWALVESDNKPEVREFVIVGTGYPCEYDSINYIGTFQLSGGRFVGHLFEA